MSDTPHRHHHKRSHHKEKKKKSSGEVPREARSSEKMEKAQCMKLLHSVAQLPQNKFCADCRETGTEWVAVNLGVFLCIRCAGVHRSLGTHVSKVKSISMDSWSIREVLMVKILGNELGQQLFEGTMPARVSAQPVDNEAQRRERIHRKYVELTFAAPETRKVLKHAHKMARQAVEEGKWKEWGRISGEGINPLPSPFDTVIEGSHTAAKHERAAVAKAIYGEEAFTEKEKKKRKAIPAPSEDGSESKTKGGSRKKHREGQKSKGVSSFFPGKPMHSVFGIVNVPSEAVEQYLDTLYRCFGIPLPSPAPQEACNTTTMNIECAANTAEPREEPESVEVPQEP